VVAKPTGPTSHDVVGLVRRLSATRRIGHGGTLDPFASGVLPLFLGHATRLAEYHLGRPKAYRATVCLGESSTTDDIEGERTPASGPAPTRAQVEALLPAFTGQLSQRPPAFSAVKVAGRRAYALARAGERFELRPRAVVVHEITLTEWDETEPARPIAVLELVCSAGTYVRSLARDLGAAAGSGAYLGALTRTRAGVFRLDEAVTLDTIREAAVGGPEGIARLLLPMDAGLDDLPAVTVSGAEAEQLAEGRFVIPAAGLPADAASAGGPIRVLTSNGRLVAIAAVRGGRLAPEKVLVDRSAPVVAGQGR